MRKNADAENMKSGNVRKHENIGNKDENLKNSLENSVCNPADETDN